MYYIIRALARFALAVLFKAKVSGLETVPRKGPLIVASNHVSILDPIVVGALLNRKVHYMAKEELFPNALASWFLRSIGVFPVARGKGDRSAIKKALELLAKGEVMGIFPEGTRSEDGKLSSPQPGTAMLVERSGAPVLTVACVGTFEAFPRGSKLPRRVPIELRVGELLTPQELGLVHEGSYSDDKQAMRKEARRRLEAAGHAIMASIGRLLE